MFRLCGLPLRGLPPDGLPLDGLPLDGLSLDGRSPFGLRPTLGSSPLDRASFRLPLLRRRRNSDGRRDGATAVRLRLDVMVRLEGRDGQLVDVSVKLQRQTADVTPIPFPDAGLGVGFTVSDDAVAGRAVPRHAANFSSLLGETLSPNCHIQSLYALLLVTGLLLSNDLGSCGLPSFWFRGSDLLAYRQRCGNRAGANRRRRLDAVINFEGRDGHALGVAVKRQFQTADVAAVEPHTRLFIKGAVAHFGLADWAAPSHGAATVSLLDELA